MERPGRWSMTPEMLEAHHQWQTAVRLVPPLVAQPWPYTIALPCTIVQEQIMYQWILSDFSFGDFCVKNYQGPTTSRENAFRKYLNFPQNSHKFFLIFCVIMA